MVRARGSTSYRNLRMHQIGTPADEDSSSSEEEENPYVATIGSDESDPEAPPGYKWESMAPTAQGKSRFRLRRDHELTTREPWYEGVDEEFV